MEVLGDATVPDLGYPARYRGSERRRHSRSYGYELLQPGTARSVAEAVPPLGVVSGAGQS